jgi:Arc/MetJ-type ribon-helix-helix transcriptional regulator
VNIELKPETERLVQEEIDRGYFRSLDELIVESVRAWHEMHSVEDATPPRSLYELLTQPPFFGGDLKIERQKDLPRDINL